MHTNGTYLKLVLIIIFTTFKAYSVESSWIGRTKFNGEPAGIIRALLVQDSHIYVGAENGFFDIVGNESKIYSHDNSALELGYISDLAIDVNGDIWIVQFGSGIYRFSPLEQKIEKLKLSGIM